MIWSLIKSVLGPIAIPLAALAGAGLTFLAMSAYDDWIDDPAVTQAARAEYVHESELSSLKAQLELERRMRTSAELAAADYASQLVIVRQVEEAQNQQRELERNEYEARLENDDRSCGLTDADVEWLQRHD